MFTLLNPFVYWLGFLSLIPLVIHFLGKSRTKKILFPSLLLIEKPLVHSTRRHRLKNLLLLLCRTLLVVCLLLALGKPVFVPRKTVGNTIANPVVLLNNGAWSFLGVDDGHTLLTLQKSLITSLDTLAPDRVLVVPLISSTGGKMRKSGYWRFGRYDTALEKIETLLAGEKATHLYIPVMRWQALSGLSEKIETLCRVHPLLNVYLLDYSGFTLRPIGLERPDFSFPPEKPEIIITSRLNPATLKGEGPVKIRLTLNGRLKGENIVETGDDATQPGSIQFNIPKQKYVTGCLTRFRQAGFGPYDRHFFSFLSPGNLRILHVGSDLTSLAALGKPGYAKSIHHVAELTGGALLNNLGQYNLICLSNAAITSDGVYPKLLEYVRTGGTLVVSLGDRSDIPRLNREILVPAKMGYAGASGPGPSGKEKVSIHLNADALDFEEPAFDGITLEARVSRQFKFMRDQNARVVLSTKTGPLLLRSDVLKGRLFLWITDPDNLEWTTLGFSAFLPLWYRTLLHDDTQEKWPSRQVDSDSIYIHNIPQNTLFQPVIQDPEGRPFNAVRKQYGHIHIGPFPDLGLYRLLNGEDTTLLAVNLAALPEPSGPGEFRDKLKEGVSRQIEILPPDKIRLGALPTRHPLWRLFAAAAAVFFLLEGLILLFFSKRPMKTSG
jgi:hypothetical protein